jgi:hypothetical protein
VFLNDLGFYVALSDVRNGPGGVDLSSDCAQLCAVLIQENPMPDPRVETAIDLARRLGTYNKTDRSAQYAGRSYNAEALRRNDDIAFRKLRELENYQLRNQLVTIVASALISALLAWAVKVL